MRIIAEIGIHHGGDIRRAEELIASAAACGATDVKIQYFTERDLAGRQKATGWPALKMYTLQAEKISELWAFANGACHVELGVSFFGLDGVNAFRRHGGELDWAKIPACRSANEYMIRAARELLRPMVVSYYPNHEIHSVHADGADIALHCTDQYPTPDAELYLARIYTLPQAFGTVGWSCHAEARPMKTPWLACLAYAAGARVFEFHFMDDKVTKVPKGHIEWADQQVSLNPALLANTIQELEKCAKVMGG